MWCGVFDICVSSYCLVCVKCRDSVGMWRCVLCVWCFGISGVFGVCVLRVLCVVGMCFGR